MKTAANLISKKVITLQEGECVGYVLNICVDEEDFKILGFLVADDESEVVNFLSLNNIVSVGEYILIKSSNTLEFGEMTEANSPIGKEVISDFGTSLGFVLDYEIENKKIRKIITNKCEINPKNIISFKGKYLIFSDKKKKIKKSKIIFPKVEENIPLKVEIQSNKTWQKPLQKNSVQIPFKSSISTEGLIGKIAVNDVYGRNSEILIRKNEVVTEKVVKLAKKHNKLNNLIFNCK